MELHNKIVFLETTFLHVLLSCYSVIVMRSLKDGSEAGALPLEVRIENDSDRKKN